ncbi:MAG: RNA recognition motif domain-containing protein [Nodosilinea sp.]
MSIYVGNLSYDVTRQDLEQVFQEYGSVKRVSLPMNRETNTPRGFAFVDMEVEEQEAIVIEALDGAEWMGRSMKVNKALPRDNSDKRNGEGQYTRSSF